MNVLVLQCGGPTSVINASLWGVINAGQIAPSIRRIWGARLGWQGLVLGDWAELTHFHNRIPPYLENLPGAALGSGRYPLTDAEMPTALAQLLAHAINGVLVIGGNGAITAAHRLHQAAEAAGYRIDDRPLQVIGIPKTVDNDLMGTDFTPGYGSAARFIAQTVHDVGLDLWSMRNYDDVVVVEVMGRHVGWLAAAAALARQQAMDPPHLILLPEVPFHEDAFLARVTEVHQSLGVCLVVVAEGTRDTSGFFLAEKGPTADALEQDGTGQVMLGFAAGAAFYLASLVRERLGLRCRQLRPDLIQRASGALVSRLDRRQAARVGAAAVEALADGHSDVMIGLKYHPRGWLTVPEPLAKVVGHEKALPAHFMDGKNFDVTDAFVDYARPLVGDLELGAVRW